MSEIVAKQVQLRGTRELITALSTKTDEALSSFQSLENAYLQGHITSQVWQRLIFIALNALEKIPVTQRELFLEIARRNCFKLLNDETCRVSTLQQLLDFLFANYTDTLDGVKGLFIEQLDLEVRLNHPGTRHELVNLLVHQRRIFEIPYSDQQTDRVVAIINQVLKRGEHTSEQIQSKLASRWLLTALREDAQVPPGVRRSIRNRLSQEDLTTLNPNFVLTVYRHLFSQIEVELEQTLELLTQWFPAIDIITEPQQNELSSAFSQYASGKRLLTQGSLELNIVMANCLVKKTDNLPSQSFLLRKIEQWSLHPRIPAKILKLCHHLPITRWESQELLKMAQTGGPLSSLLPELIDLLQIHTVGISREIPFWTGDEKDASLQNLLKIRERIIEQGKDEVIINFLVQIGNDGHCPDDVRQRAYRALVKIFPHNLDVRLNQYLDEHSPNDINYGLVLEIIGSMKMRNCWPAVSRALAAWAGAEPATVITLINTAGQIGDLGIIKSLVPLAFDHQNPLVCQKARQTLERAGYGMAVRLETLRRELIRLDDELYTVKEQRRLNFEESSKLEIELADTDRQRSLSRTKLSELQQLLDLTVVNFNLDYTDFHLELAKIDKQVRALLERIKLLTERKIVLESKLEHLHQERVQLREHLDTLQTSLMEEKERQRQLREEIKLSISRARELRTELKLTTQQCDQELAELGQVRAAESKNLQWATQRSTQLHHENETLNQELRKKQTDLGRIEQSLNKKYRQIQEYQNRLEDLERRVEVADYFREGAIRKDIESVRKQQQNINTSTEERKRQKLNREINELTQQRQVLEGEHHQVEHQVSTSQKQMRRMETQVRDIKARQVALQRNLKMIEQRILALKSELRQHQEVTRKLQETAESLEVQTTRLEQAARALEKQLAPVILDLDGASRELNHWLAEKNRVEAEISAMQQSYQSKIDEQNRTLKKEIEWQQQLNQRLSQIANRLQQAYAAMRHSDAEINRLNATLLDRREEFKRVNELDAEQQQTSDQQHAAETRQLYLEKDQREQSRLVYAYQLNRACQAFTTRQPDWLESKESSTSSPRTRGTTDTRSRDKET